MGDNSRFTVTKKEYKRILTLPKKTALFEQGRFTGLYDEKTERFYLTDEEGNLTGITSIVPREKFMEEEIKQAVRKANPDVFRGEHHTENVFTTKEKVKKAKKKKRKADGLLIMSAVLAFFLVVIVGAIILARCGVINLQDFVEKELAGLMPTSSISACDFTEVSCSDTVEVASLKRDVLKGEQITQSDVMCVEIEGTLYNQSYLLGENILRWEQVQQMLPVSAACYIGAGQVLRSSDMGFAVLVDDTANPWIASDGSIVLEVPVTKGEELAHIGENVVISAFGTTSNLSGLDSKYYQNVKNIRHFYNGSDDKFEITGNMIVCDVISETGESLFGKISDFAKMPCGDAVAKHAFSGAGKFVPQYYQISINSEQGICLQQFINSGMKIFVAGTNTFDTGTAAKLLYRNIEAKVF